MNRKKTTYMTEMAMFAALIIVLQVIATFIKIGSFPITLTLIPIIVAGAIYGVPTGFLMGSVFGAIVWLMVITGGDPGGQGMFMVRPVVTTVVCFLKGALCGGVAALVFKILAPKNEKLALLLAGITCPIVNTVTLYIVLILFFESSFAAVLSALISVNFLIELSINALLAPGLYVLIKQRRNLAKQN